MQDTFPTSLLDTFETRLAQLDGAERSAVFASDMAAVSTALLALLEPGDHVVATQPLRSSILQLLKEVMPRFGIQTAFVPAGTDTVAAVREEAARIRGDRLRLVWIETPTDPTNLLVDIEAIAHLADRLSFRRARRVLTAVDNTLLGPLFQHPVQQAADLVHYSNFGAISGSRTLVDPIAALRGILGTNANGFAGWLLLRALETIEVRTKHAAETASQLARRLVDHRAVERVRHLSLIDAVDPQHRILQRHVSGFGSMLALEIKGGAPEAARVMERLERISAEQPIPGVIRLQVELQPFEQLERDLLQALDAVHLISEPREDARTTEIVQIPIV